MRNRLLILFFLAALFAPMASQAQQTITLKADSVTVPCHDVDTFLIPIRVFDFENVAGLQFSFSWNPTHLKYVHIADVNPAFFGIGFDTTTFITAGKFTFSWTTSGGLTLPDSAVLFQVAFTRLGGPATLAAFSNTPTDIYAIDALGNDINVATAPGLVSPIDIEPPSVVCPGNVTAEVFGPSPVDNIAPASILDNCSIESIGWSSAGATPDNPANANDPDASGAIFNLGQSTVTYLVADAGGNTASCSFLVNLTLTPNDSLTLIASNGAGTCGETITINISVLNFDSIGGIQFSLGWDPAVLGFDTILNTHPSMLLDISSNFGTQQTGNGFISFAWTSALPFGLSIVDGSVLFSLTFNVLANSNNSTTVAFGDFPTDMLAISSATNPSQEIGFLIVDGSVVITDTEPPVLECPADVSVATPAGVLTANFNNLAPVTLTDNCSAAISLGYEQTGATTGSGTGPANGTYNAGTTVVTYTATDGSGNTSTCSFTVLVDAGTPLTLLLDTIAVDCQDTTFAISLTVRDFVNIIGLQFDIQWDSSIIKFDSVGNLRPGFGLNDPTKFFGFTSAIDGNTLKFFNGSVGGWPAIPDNDTLFTIFFGIENLGTSNINFTGTISAVNSSLNFVPVAVVNGFFSVSDFTPPDIVCPMDMVIPADSAACVATFLLDPAQATDVCSAIASIVPDKTDDIYPAGPTVVTFTATDAAGNSATCSTTVTVQGDALPQLTNCPPDVTVGAFTANCSAAVIWDLPQAFNPCDGMNLQVESSDTSGTVFPLGDNAVTFLAFNLSGDTVSCSFTVTVRDSLAPSVSCPGDYMVQADSAACSAFVQFDLPVGADNCDQNILLVGSAQPGDEFPVGTTPVTFVGTDASDNTDSCTFMITVFDLNPPVFDNCPADVTVYSAVDSCGASVFWDSILVTDDCSGNLSVDPPNYSGEFFSIGDSQVSYFATDAGGNIQSCAFTVTVLDTIQPMLSPCPADIIIFLPVDTCDSAVSWIPPGASDPCGLAGDPVPSELPGTVFPTGVHTVTYTVEDVSGNTATCAFVITIKDEEPPVFTGAGCPQNIVVPNASPCGEVVNWTLPTAMDNCLLDTVIATIQPTDTIFNQITTVVIRALDASGNADTCTFTITLDVVIVPPALDSFPANITVNGCPQPVTWTLPLSNGKNCNPDTILYEPALLPGDTFPNGTTEIVYYLMDQVTGDTLVQDTFSVTVQDIEPPTLSGCPTEPVIVHIGGLIVSDSSGFLTAPPDTVAGCTGVEVFFGLPTAVDDCGNAVVDQTGGPLSGMLFPGDSISTLVFVATDDNGNTSECLVNVGVVGLQPLVPMVDPLVACPGGEVILMVDQFPGATYTWTGPAAIVPG
ncbi:MAG: HYR domain-containing protein [Lewinellaceae bacterium]|nr:HYR domain-containing protein [Lewinellaceae bacterium]